MIYWVDLPDSNALDGSWTNVAEFDTRPEAVEFIRDHFGGDEEGRISLITEGGSPDEEEADDGLTPAITNATRMLLGNARLLRSEALEVARWLQERAAEAGRPVPKTTEGLAAWALDELGIRVKQAQDYPEEADDRLPFAARLAFLVAALLWSGAVPSGGPTPGVAGQAGER